MVHFGSLYGWQKSSLVLTHEDSHSVGTLYDLPEVVSLHLLDGVIAGVLLDHQPLQDALLLLQVPGVHHGLLSCGRQVRGRGHGDTGDQNGSHDDHEDSLLTKVLEEDDRGHRVHPNCLGKCLVLKLDNRDPGSVCIIVNVL